MVGIVLLLVLFVYGILKLRPLITLIHAFFGRSKHVDRYICSGKLVLRVHEPGLRI